MKKSQSNKIAMYRSVASVLDNFQSSWLVLPAFQGLRDEFQEKLSLLIEMDNDQRTIAKDAGSEKKDRKLRLAQKAKDVQSALIAYAVSTENTILLRKVKFAPSRFKYGSAMESRAMVDLIIEKAEAHLSGLADYGIDATDVADLINKRDEVVDGVTAPRNKIVSRKAITRTIRITIERMDVLLQDQLDRLVSTLESTETRFHMEYFDSRIIVDHVSGRSASGENGSGGSPEENPIGL